MLQAAIFGSTAGLQKYSAFLNAMLAFEMPRVPELANSKGVAFDKNRPNAVRPIAIAEAWLRLDKIICLHQKPDSGTDLADAGQLEVGIPEAQTISDTGSTRPSRPTLPTPLSSPSPGQTRSTHPAEQSVALIKCQGSAYRGCANLLARAASRQVSPGADFPYED